LGAAQGTRLRPYLQILRLPFATPIPPSSFRPPPSLSPSPASSNPPVTLPIPIHPSASMLPPFSFRYILEPLKSVFELFSYILITGMIQYRICFIRNPFAVKRIRQFAKHSMLINKLSKFIRPFACIEIYDLKSVI